MLTPDGEPPLSKEDFVQTCVPWLTRDDLAVFTGVMTNTYAVGSHVVLDSWNGWDTALRNELSRIRAQRKGIEQDAYVRPESGGWILSDVAKEIVQQENPLEAERTLTRLQWEFLSELEAPFYFEFERILIFYLKLALLIRKSQFTKERGGQRFEATYRTMAAPFTETSTGE